MTITIKQAELAKVGTKAVGGRVIKVSCKSLPTLDAKAKARLESGGQKPHNSAALSGVARLIGCSSSVNRDRVILAIRIAKIK